MSDAAYERIRDSEWSHTVQIRTDLLIDVDRDGLVVGVERIGDQVRPRDLEDVIRFLVYVAPSDTPEETPDAA